MSWVDLYLLVRQMTTGWKLGGRACFAAIVSAFLYHERYHTSNAVDHLARTRRFPRRKAYRKIEKFLHRKTINLEVVWQWLWDNYTAQIKDCFVLVDRDYVERRKTSPDGCFDALGPEAYPSLLLPIKSKRC